MTRLRRAVASIAVAWLSCQAGLLIAAPILFWAGAAEELVECTCTHGDHTLCPMHHRPKPGTRTCVMQNADSNDAAMLASVFGFVGTLTTSTAIVVPTSTEPLVRAAATTPLRRPGAPDPPPPRA